MKLLAVLSCFLVSCLAGKPHPCFSPSPLSGAFSVSSQNEKLWGYSPFVYDAEGERIRIMEVGSYENKSFTYDVLLLYKENTMYEIFQKNHTCKKRPFKAEFQPIGVTKGASLVAQLVLGSSSGPGQGLLVNTWMGELPNKQGRYIETFTEYGCIPVSFLYHTDTFGWLLTSFFNNVIGISDPSKLNPPDFCSDAKMEERREGEEPNFINFFLPR